MADIVPSTFPLMITCEPVSLVGFNRIGFIAAIGSIPAASACITCALPISRPSSVMYEFNAMFWDLNGAAFTPSCASTRRSPPVSTLFPAFDMVPCIIIGFAICHPPISNPCYLSHHVSHRSAVCSLPLSLLRSDNNLL